MSPRIPNEEPIFDIAKRMKDSEARADYLALACKNNSQLQERILELLQTEEQQESASGGESDEVPDADFTRESSLSGMEQIGPYKIREKIGEGGMGVVYVAEQTEPVQRKVALKVIKPGMDTKEVIARFEAERQALAFMEHPNIARVLDAGATESGRSYFVMELVRGIPITDYCDQARATPRERLELFQTVCDAVQHAHQKGIIHRDIKPSNVLITQVGAKPVVKVIDFGLAKATSGQKLTEKTVYTGFMRLMGTPAYMSPEQAGLSGLDIDTRSDVYSLGVLLYELLTGSTPIDKTEIQRKAYEEVCRHIREVEAPKPSARISTLKDADRSTVAQQRQVQPGSLRQLLNGDLDRVVLKALEKDRERRYETPRDLAADVERFLDEQPVLAVPPSPVYLARKYFRRHRAAILTGTAIVLSLLLATAFSTRQAIVATRAEKAAAIDKQKAEEARYIAEQSENEARAATEQAKENAVRAAEAKQVAVEEKKKAEQSELAAVAAKKDAENSEALALVERDNAEQTADERQRLLRVANIAQAAQLWDSPNGDLRKIEELITAWMPKDEDVEDRRDFTWRLQWTQLHKSSELTKLKTTGATISPEGHLLTADDRGLHRWNATGTDSSMIWSGDASVVSFSKDRRWAAVTIDELTRLVEVSRDGKALSIGRRALDFPHSLFSFSPRGDYLAAWKAGSQTASVWKLTGPEPEPAAPLEITGYATMPAMSSKLQLCDDGESFLLRGYPIYPCVSVFFPEKEPFTWWHRNSAGSCAWSPNGKIMASGSFTGMLHLRLRSNPREKIVVSTHGKGLEDLCFSPDGTRLIVGGSDGTFDVWDTSALLRLSNEWEQEEGLEAEPETGSDESSDANFANLLSEARPILLGTTKAHLTSGSVSSLVFSADGSRVATRAGEVSKLWQIDRVRGRYEVANFGEDMFSGRLAISTEDSDQGIRVSQIHAGNHDVVNGELRVGDILVGASDERLGELDFSNKQRRQVVPFFYNGPLNSTTRLTVEGESGDRREVELRRSLKSDPRPIRVCFSPDGKTVAIAGQRTGTTSINLETGRTARYPQPGSNSVAISPDGRLLAMDGWNDLLVWDLRRDQEYARLDSKVSVDPVPMNGSGGSIAFSPDGKFLAMGTGYPYNSGTKRSDLKVWRVDAMQDQPGGKVVFKNNRVLSDITFSPDARYLIATDHAGIVRVWETETWKLTERKFEVGSSSSSLAISDDGKLLATGGSRRAILWDFQTGEKIRVLSGPSPWSLDFSPDGRTLVSGSRNHNVILWDVATGMQMRTLHAHSDAVNGVAFAGDGNMLATVGSEGVLRLWEAASLEEIDSYPPTLESVLRLGQLRNLENQFAEAESIMRRLLRRRNELDDDTIRRIREELTTSLRAQGRMPEVEQKLSSLEVGMDDSVTLNVDIKGKGPWDCQWFCNGILIEGATGPELRIDAISADDLGSYHVEVLPMGEKDVIGVNSSWIHLVESGAKPNQGLVWETFVDIPGSQLSDLTNSDKFLSNNPDKREIIDAFDIPRDVGDNYGGRLTGFLTVPKTGEYRFYLCSDNHSEFYLSEDESPEKEALIASLTGWSKPAQWSLLKKESVSKPIYLERGKRYSLRVLYREMTGGDHLMVNWQLPGAPQPIDGAPPIPGSYLQHRQE